MRCDHCFLGPFVQWPYWGIFIAKPTHSQAVFTLWVYIPPPNLPLSRPFCSHWINLPRTLLEVTSCSELHDWLCRRWRLELILSCAETCHIFLKTILLGQLLDSALLVLQTYLGQIYSHRQTSLIKPLWILRISWPESHCQTSPISSPWILDS